MFVSPYVCPCVCSRVRIVCSCVRMYVCVSVCMILCPYVCSCVRMYVRVSVCMFVCPNVGPFDMTDIALFTFKAL